MNNSIKVMTGTALFTALAILLYFLPIKVGPLSINLSLVPLALAAIIYGPLPGLFIGLLIGGIVLIDPTTSAFLAYNPFVTVLLCLLKTGLAGLLSGFIAKWIKNNQPLSVIVSSISVPLVNTGLFAVGCLLFFIDESFIPSAEYLFLTMIGLNFIIEFSVIAILSPTIVYLAKIITKRMKNA